MSLFDRAVKKIEENKFKKYNCIPFDEAYPRFSEYLPGIQRRYYLVSGASGAGKSQVTDDFFLFHPFNFLENNETDIKLKVFYYSLEMDAETKMHQWISRRLYQKYGIRTSIDILQSVGKNRINDNIYMAVMETREYFEKLEDILIMKDGSINPQGIINDIESYARSNGEVINKSIKIKDEEKQVFDHYKAHDPNEYVEIVIDNYNLLNVESGMQIKQTIEKLSKFFVKARNRYGYTPVAIQQQSAESENLEHFKALKLEPNKQCLGDSKLTYNDCDIALGIFQPQKHDIKTYRGYNISEMGDNYRNVNIFKNRYGISNVNVGLYFDGAVNFFRELPRADLMNSSTYDRIKQKKPNF